MKFYATMADHVNNRPYAVTHSARFENIPLLLTIPSSEEAVMAHPHQDLLSDPYMEVGARVTIHQMVLMCSAGIGFKLAQLRDAVEILYVIDGYVEEMRSNVMTDEVKTYLEKLAPFRERILGRVRYLIRTDPMMADLYEEKNPLIAFLGQVASSDTPPHPRAADGAVLNGVPLEQLLTGDKVMYDY